jgi:hypothetical protein
MCRRVTKEHSDQPATYLLETHFVLVIGRSSLVIPAASTESTIWLCAELTLVAANFMHFLWA